VNSNTKIAVLQAGIVPPETLPELERWGMQLPEDIEVETDRKMALANIRESIESSETVAVRETDLDALRNYDKYCSKGRLYYSIPDPSKGADARKTTFVDVTYAITTIGNYLIPWTDEDIYDLMLDEGTYLKPAGVERVYFDNVVELYYGERKAFMTCTPARPAPRQS
jgi:hypothetical protein